MKKYNYREALREDIRNYITENEITVTPDTVDELEDRLRDELFCEDSVTGNGSGSYTFNAWRAEENLCHNLDLLGEALEEFDCSSDYLAKKGAEACDVTIRCYLMPQVLGQVLRELADEYEEDEFREDFRDLEESMTREWHEEEAISEELDRIARGEK